MKVFNDDIMISRNESFVYDRYVENKDGSPYIVSSRLTSPMIRISIADETYVSEERYILNRYIDLNSSMTQRALPRFYSTKPIRLMSGETEYATSWSNIPGDTYNPLPDDVPEDVTIYNYAVYYIIDATGVKEYKMYVHGDNEDTWEFYSFRITIPYGVQITRNWTSKNYIYAIYLMDGTLYIDIMRDKVTDILMEEEGVSQEVAYQEALAMTEQELYNEILEYNNKDGHVTDVALIDGREVVIDMSDKRWSPYWSVDCNIPMLNPAKITVKNDPIGGLV